MELCAPGTENDTDNQQDTESERIRNLKAILKNSGKYENVFDVTTNKDEETVYCRACKCPVKKPYFIHEMGELHEQNIKLVSEQERAKYEKEEIKKDEKNDVKKADVTEDDGAKKERKKYVYPTMYITPGEPVPPGFEEEISAVPHIQKKIDTFKVLPLVGLEYLVELQDDDPKQEYCYLCALCDANGRGVSFISHLFSSNHLRKFMATHFTKCFRILAPYMIHQKNNSIWHLAMQKIAEAIEKKYGRLRPLAIEKADFEKDKNRYMNLITNGSHFSETIGCTFEEIVTPEELEKMSQGKPATIVGKPVINTAGSLPKPAIGTTFRNNPSALVPKKEEKLNFIPPPSILKSLAEAKSGKPANKHVPRKIPTAKVAPVNVPIGNARGRQPPLLPYERPKSPSPPRKKSKCTLEIVTREMQEERRRKIEEFRKLSRAIESDMQNLLKKQVQKPEKHPRYKKEWNQFWNNRSKVLQAVGVDITTHDFKPEWIIYWNKRMVDLHSDELRNKKDALRKRLDLPEEEYLADWAKGIPIKPKPVTIEKDTKGNISKGNDKKRDICSGSPRSQTHRRSRSPNRSRKSPARRSRSRNRDRVARRSRSRDKNRHSGRAERRSRSKSKPKNVGKTKEQNSKDAASSKKSKEIIVDLTKDDTKMVTKKEYRRGSRDRSLSSDSSLSEERSLSRERRSPSRSRKRSSSKEPTKSRSPTRDKNVNRDVRSRRSLSRGKEKGHAANIPRDLEKGHTKSYAEFYTPSPGARDGPRPSILQEEEDDDEAEVNIVDVLRILCALEERLGSLGTRVVDLLTRALCMEKNEPNSAETLLDSDINCMLFETAKEKLKGHLLAGLVDVVQERAFKRAIKKIATLIYMAAQRKRQMARLLPTLRNPPAPAIDRDTITKQIATSLIMQGKTHITQGELEELVNNAARLAESSKNSDESVSAANFLQPINMNQISLDVPKITEKVIIPTQYKDSNVVENKKLSESPATGQISNPVNLLEPSEVIQYGKISLVDPNKLKTSLNPLSISEPKKLTESEKGAKPFVNYNVFDLGNKPSEQFHVNDMGNPGNTYEPREKITVPYKTSGMLDLNKPLSAHETGEKIITPTIYKTLEPPKTREPSLPGYSYNEFLPLSNSYNKNDHLNSGEQISTLKYDYDQLRSNNGTPLRYSQSEPNKGREPPPPSYSFNRNEISKVREPFRPNQIDKFGPSYNYDKYGPNNGRETSPSHYNLGKFERNTGSRPSSHTVFETSSDYELQLKLRDYHLLSREEQSSLTNYLSKLELTQPERVNRLRRFVDTPSGLKSGVQSGTSGKYFTPKISPVPRRMGNLNDNVVIIDSDEDEGYGKEPRSLNFEPPKPRDSPKFDQEPMPRRPLPYSRTGGAGGTISMGPGRPIPPFADSSRSAVHPSVGSGPFDDNFRNYFPPHQNERRPDSGLRREYMDRRPSDTQYGSRSGAGNFNRW